MSLNGTSCRGYHYKSMGMNEASISWDNKNSLQNTLMSKNWCSRTGEAMGSLTVVVSVVELNWHLHFQTKANGCCTNIFFCPTVAWRTISINTHGFYRLTSTKMKDIALVVGQSNHKVIRRHQLIKLFNRCGNYLQEVLDDNLFCFKFSWWKLDMIRHSLFTIDTILFWTFVGFMNEPLHLLVCWNGTFKYCLLHGPQWLVLYSFITCITLIHWLRNQFAFNLTS